MSFTNETVCGFAVIEYALLFGLGFVTAILVAFLLAPAIHGRIVKFTENRILSTMPVNRQELRAQKDMVRAEMAVSVARTSHDLKVERQKAAQLSLVNDQLSAEASRLYGESSELRAKMEEMTIQASEMRASVRNAEIRLDQMQEALAAQQKSEKGKDAKIDQLMHRIDRLNADIDNLRIDLVTRDTEAEALRARINALRDDRDSARNELKHTLQRAKDAELRLAREENRATRLEDRLNAEVAGSVDKDTIIERRMSEIVRLKERLKNANAYVRETARSLRASGLQKQASAARVRTAPANGDERLQPAPPVLGDEDTGGDKPAFPGQTINATNADDLTEEVRGQANSVADTLLVLDGPSQDEAMRQEIADIAAKMIAIVGQREGSSSPVHAMISGKTAEGENGRLSLSRRAAMLLQQN